MDTSSEINELDKVHDNTIIVNGREKQWFSKKISYSQVIVLAFGFAENNANTSYTVTFKRGDNNKPEGIMVEGVEIAVKEAMRFNVTLTNRS